MRIVWPSVATSFAINELSLSLTKEQLRHNISDFLANEISEADSPIFWLNIELTVELGRITRGECESLADALSCRGEGRCR